MNEIKNKNFDSLQLNIGDVVFYSTMLIHRTGLPKNKEAFRIAVNFSFNNYLNNEFIKRNMKLPDSGKPNQILINPNKYLKNI